MFLWKLLLERDEECQQTTTGSCSEGLDLNMLVSSVAHAGMALACYFFHGKVFLALLFMCYSEHEYIKHAYICL